MSHCTLSYIREMWNILGVEQDTAKTEVWPTQSALSIVYRCPSPKTLSGCCHPAAGQEDRRHVDMLQTIPSLPGSIVIWWITAAVHKENHFFFLPLSLICNLPLLCPVMVLKANKYSRPSPEVDSTTICDASHYFTLDFWHIQLGQRCRASFSSSFCFYSQQPDCLVQSHWSLCHIAESDFCPLVFPAPNSKSS